MEIPLIIADEDHDYVTLLSSYITSNQEKYFSNVKCFSNKDYLQQFLPNIKKPYFMVVSEDMLSFVNELEEDLDLILLRESPEVEDNNVPSIFKYQSMDQVITQIVSMYQEEKDSSNQESKHIPILSVYSAVGGCGKTTIALNLAKQLASTNVKVFYFNLELNSSSVYIHEDKTNDLSQLLYYLEVKPDQVAEKLQLLTRLHPEEKFFYISPPNHIREIMHLSEENVKSLLDSIIKTNKYDVIIVDLDSSLENRNLEALKNSTYIWWIVVDDLYCLEKTVKAKEGLKALIPQATNLDAKMKFIMNKYTGIIRNDFLEQGIHLIGELPYIPTWKTIYENKQIFSESFFRSQVNKTYVHTMDSRGDLIESY